MTEISKHLFTSCCKDLHCSVLMHPWDRSCFTSSVSTYKNSLYGSAKFYLIVHLLQNIIKGKKVLSKKELMKAAEYYVRSTLLGMIISGSSITLSCFFRWMLGRKFTYYTYLFVPSTLNGITILLEPPKRRGLVTNLFFNLFIEYWMRVLERAGYISITKTKQVFLFMVGSALLFYLMRLEGDKEKRTPILWLFTPEKVRKLNEVENVCPHSGSCFQYIAKGYLQNFGLGLAFALAKLLLPKIGTPMRALSSLRWRHLDIALFFGSYIGIYRAIVCYLCKKQGFDSALYALPAGYIAGLSFIFKPNLGFAIASLTGAFKIFSTILYDKKMIPEKIPFTVIIYCISQGVLYHARCMDPEVCPKYVINVMNSVSNGLSNLIHKNLLTVVSKDYK
ncbi:transmembrane protein 135-like [Danaus plexippus]|nr:transmembrane protein 135-like [Danaus plexippus]XP_061384629.1 transmembrane protein 135-like [Danaus plexippus]XP_061384630.1 transmembrane protein 135-like [Danaus plexippus]